MADKFVTKWECMRGCPCYWDRGGDLIPNGANGEVLNMRKPDSTGAYRYNTFLKCKQA